MSSSNSDSDEYESRSSASECIFEEERDFVTENESGHSDDEDDELEDAYADEPLADEEWLAEYNKKQDDTKKQLEELKRRKDGAEPTNSWCKCGNCNTELLENPKECCCCAEIQKCATVLSDKEVLEAVGEQPLCITQHPGFGALCLNRWCLEVAAGSFKTREGRRYRQIGSKERFLRGIAYRQFTRLVHGRLKEKRIPLPACAYHAIRSTFKVEGNNYGGYEELVSDQE